MWPRLTLVTPSHNKKRFGCSQTPPQFQKAPKRKQRTKTRLSTITQPRTRHLRDRLLLHLVSCSKTQTHTRAHVYADPSLPPSLPLAAHQLLLLHRPNPHGHSRPPFFVSCGPAACHRLKAPVFPSAVLDSLAVTPPLAPPAPGPPSTAEVAGRRSQPPYLLPTIASASSSSYRRHSQHRCPGALLLSFSIVPISLVCASPTPPSPPLVAQDAHCCVSRLDVASHVCALPSPPLPVPASGHPVTVPPSLYQFFSLALRGFSLAPSRCRFLYLSVCVVC